MKNLTIKRAHDLDEQECRDLAEDLLGQLIDRYGGSKSVHGDCFEYRHKTGMKAVVEPKAGELEINVKLNLMTRTFGPEIEKQVNRVLDKYID